MSGVDLGAGADVDAAGRLVEQQHLGAVDEPAGEQDLLLVAAGQGPGHAVGVGGTQLERLDLLAAHAALAALVEQRRSGEPREGREGHVLEDRLVEQQALALALLGREADARVDRVAHRARPQRLAVDRHRAAGRLARAVDGLEDLRAARADEPGETDDLAGAHRERRRR